MAPTNKISEIDAKIIRDLLKDGRKDFADIAKECGVQKNTIWKRYKEMQKAGIIVGATIQMNFRRFGYDVHSAILLSVEFNQVNEVIEQIKKLPNIHEVSRIYGRYNVRAILILKNLSELNDYKELIRQETSASDLKIYVMTETRYTPENLSLGAAQQLTGKNAEANVKSRDEIKKAAVKLDEVDEQILEKLAENGRAPFSKIAEAIGVTTDTVIRRYRKLTENGIIKVSIQIDPTKLGYSVMMNVLIALTPSANAAATAETISKIPNVTALVKVAGDYDMHVFTLIRDAEQMITILNEIERARGVSRMEPSVELLSHKYPAPRRYISTF